MKPWNLIGTEGAYTTSKINDGTCDTYTVYQEIFPDGVGQAAFPDDYPETEWKIEAFSAWDIAGDVNTVQIIFKWLEHTTKPV